MTLSRVARALLVLLVQLELGAAIAVADGADAMTPLLRELQLGTMKAVSGDELRIYQGQTAAGDIYAMVWRARIDGTIDGDLLAMTGDEVIVTGSIARDVDVVAPKLDVSGRIGSRLRFVGKEARVSGEVGADAVVFAARTHFEPSSQVRGSLAINGGQVELAGLVDGPVWIGSGKVEINGRVSGDATVSCDELTLGPAARIEGNLTYRARKPVDVPSGAVAGVVTRTEEPIRETSAIASTKGWFGFSRARTLFDLYLAVTALAAGALFTFFFRPTVTGALARTSTGNQLADSFGVGLVAGLALLVVGLACCFLFPLSLAVLSGLAALGYFGGLVGKMAVGRFVLARVQPRAVHPLAALVVGVLLVFLINLVPIVGALIWFLVTVTGMGATLLQIREGRAA